MNDTATQANQAAMRAAVATGQRSRGAGQVAGHTVPGGFRGARAPLPAAPHLRLHLRRAWRRTPRSPATASAFAEYDFLPRVLVNTRARHQKTTIFGRTYDLPFGFPPMGGTSLAAYQGDTVLAKVAAELNTVMIQSGASLDDPGEGQGSRADRVVPGLPARAIPRSSRRSSSGRSARDSKCSC